MGYFISVFIKQRDIEDGLQLFITVIAYVGIRSPGFQEGIAVLPNTNGMGFYARKVFEVSDGEIIHTSNYK